jgi:hypothetical protein
MVVGTLDPLNRARKCRDRHLFLSSVAAMKASSIFERKVPASKTAPRSVDRVLDNA